jgi:hypothetical protein
MLYDRIRSTKLHGGMTLIGKTGTWLNMGHQHGRQLELNTHMMAPFSSGKLGFELLRLFSIIYLCLCKKYVVLLIVHLDSVDLVIFKFQPPDKCFVSTPTLSKCKFESIIRCQPDPTGFRELDLFYFSLKKVQHTRVSIC